MQRLSDILRDNRVVVSILLALVGFLATAVTSCVHAQGNAAASRARAATAEYDRDQARAERDAANRKADEAEAARRAAMEDRDKARMLHPILASFGPDVWAYRRYTFKRRSGPVSIPLGTFPDGPTYTLRFVKFSENGDGATNIEVEIDSDRPLDDRPTVTWRSGGTERQMPLVSHFGFEAKPGCRARLREDQIAVEAVVERVDMDSLELGVAAHPNDGPRTAFGNKLSSMEGDCPGDHPGD
jgi:hypothetical protein